MVGASEMSRTPQHIRFAPSHSASRVGRDEVDEHDVFAEVESL
jgi:hypothetical protein